MKESTTRKIINYESLLLQRLDELHQAVNSADELVTLNISRIIRQLFLDGSKSLFLKLPRELRKNVRFEIVSPSPPNIPGVPAPMIWCEPDGIDPWRAPNTLPRSLKNEQEFFAVKVAQVDGYTYSIREVVKFGANVLGGVHAGITQSPSEEAFLKLTSFRVFGQNIYVILLRTIGRIVLEGLRDVQYTLQKLIRFENAPGISIHFILQLAPTLAEKEYFILDFGTQLDRTRLSVFVDTRGELTLRLVDNDGQRYSVRAGFEDCRLSYGRFNYLVCEVAQLKDSTLLLIDPGGWRHVRILDSTNVAEDLHKLPMVLGSSVDGKSETEMNPKQLIVYERCLTLQEHGQLRSYFNQQLLEEKPGHVQFSGLQYLHSQNHPNFPDLESKVE